MSSDQYFIRSRGRVSGPFTVDALQRLVRRGTVSRFDEISTDRVRWTVAQAMDGLFAVAAPVGAGAGASYEEPAAAVPPAPPSAREARYFYSQRGVEVGPVDAVVLRSMAAAGAIGPQDVVWAEGAQAAYQAAQIPILASVFTGPARGYALSPDRSSPQPTSAEITRHNQGVESLATLVGIVAGGLLLLLVTFPTVVFNGHARWWWDADGNSMAVVFAAFTTLGGLAILLLSIIGRGAGRAVPCLAVASLALLMAAGWVLFSSDVTAGGVTVSLWIVSPALAIMTAGVARWRSSCGIASFRPAAISFGSVAIGLHVVMGITTAIVMSEPHGPFSPSWVRLLEVFLCLQCLAGVAAGILSIVSASSDSVGLVKTTLLLSIITMGLGIIVVLTLLGGIGSTQELLRELANLGDRSEGMAAKAILGWVMFLFVRLCLILAAFVAVIGVSFAEVLTSVNRTAGEAAR